MIYERGVAASRSGHAHSLSCLTFQPYRRIHRNARAEKQRRLIDTWETCNKKMTIVNTFLRWPASIWIKDSLPHILSNVNIIKPPAKYTFFSIISPKLCARYTRSSIQIYYLQCITYPLNIYYLRYIIYPLNKKYSMCRKYIYISPISSYRFATLRPWWRLVLSRSTLGQLLWQHWKVIVIYL